MRSLHGKCALSAPPILRLATFQSEPCPRHDPSQPSFHRDEGRAVETRATAQAHLRFAFPFETLSSLSPSKGMSGLSTFLLLVFHKTSVLRVTEATNGPSVERRPFDATHLVLGRLLIFPVFQSNNRKVLS